MMRRIRSRTGFVSPARLAPSLWTDEIDQVHVRGIGLFLDEIVFYHRRSRSLIVADLLFNLSEKDA